MDVQEILYRLLNSGQAPHPGVGGGMPQTVLGGMGQDQQQMPQAAPQAPMQPQQAQSPQPMPQSAPAPAPAGNGGRFGDILTSIFAPKQSGRNQTVAYLQKQGLDPGAATILASDKGALRSYLLKGGQKSDFDQRAAAAQQYGLDLTTPEGRNFILTGKLPESKAREIRNDANGVPRYTDTGEAVYKSDQSANNGTQFFSGRSVEAQGLNYLLDNGTLTKEQAANVAAGKPVTGPNGEIIFMTPQGLFQQPAQGGQASPINPAGGGNIPITGPKYSEDMRKAGGFAMRADAADKIVSDPAVTSAGTSKWENSLSGIPLGIGNYAVSSDYQKFDQAQRDFINAVLRRESGAAISESEFDNARKQYLPQPGDGPEVLKQKAENRRLATESLRQSANPVPSFGSPTPSVPGQSLPPADQGGDAPPASYDGDPNLWKFMTPEQRKLWQ
jgi:hypothetical protein